MALLSVQLEDFRCFQQARLELHPQATLISGANGSGKSSLLEAIFLLGRGRSFRTNQLNTVIRRGAERLRVVGSLQQGAQVISIGIESTVGQTQARIAGQNASSLAALSTTFPVQVIEPGLHKLIEEGPIRRRRLMDWGVFHVEPSYLDKWQRFHRALRQRNASLRNHHSDDVLDAWDTEFARAGEEITSARREYVESLRPFVLSIAHELLNEQFELTYSPGWSGDESLDEKLQSVRGRDRQRRTTTVGPQRADLVIRCARGLAKESISRGQQKLLAAALILGQLAYHIEYFDLHPTLLLDDPAAELDTKHLQLLVEQVSRLKAQLIITSLDPNFTALGYPGRKFHVEQGTLTPVL